MSIRSSKIVALIAAVALLGSANGAAPQTPASPAPAVQSAQAPAQGNLRTSRNDEGYILGPDDVVEVELLGQQGFKQRSKIGVDGNITLPFVGDVPAAKKTTLQLAGEVKAALEKGGYYVNPIMRIEVVGYASRYVTVLGQVGQPGLLPVDRPYRLSEVLARVGGVRQDGADYVTLTTEQGQVSNYNVKEAATGDVSKDPIVPPGSRLYVAQAELVYVSGQVKSPGSYAFATDMTVRMAIAKAGGITDIGSEKGIKVTHKDGRTEKLAMTAKVLPNDVIVVGERLF